MMNLLHRLRCWWRGLGAQGRRIKVLELALEKAAVDLLLRTGEPKYCDCDRESRRTMAKWIGIAERELEGTTSHKEEIPQ